MKSVNQFARRYVSLVCAVALIATSLAQAFAQQPAVSKRAITHKDYDNWHSIQSPTISRDGKFVAYAYMGQESDSEIVVRNLAGGTEWRAARGYRPPVPPPDDPGNPTVNFHGERRSNATHQSTTDPDSRLFKKARGHEAKLAYLGEVLMENRHGLVVDACVVPATGTD